ncbi:MAG TPA: DinB family protein [Longimicrobiaceae bacterium]
MIADAAARDILARSLAWSDAHVSFERAVRDIPVHLRGTRPPGLPHSCWELVEHIRLTQRDILDFAIAEEYHEAEWPADYWPPSPEPPHADAWDQSIAAAKEDCEALQRLARDAAVDLLAVTPHGTDQTYLREILLVLDHTAYHVGQLVLVRRALGAWAES